MRWNRVPKLLLPLALVGALTVVGGADDAKPDDKATIALPGPAAGGVVRDGHFYTVAAGQLVDVDLKQRTTTILSECYDTYPKLKPFVDVADGQACVASDGRLHIVNLKGGMILHSAEYKGEVHGLGFAGKNRVFVLGRTDVVIVDVASGETAATIAIPKDEPTRSARPGALSAHQKVGKLLYVADSDQKCVKVVDLEEGKVLDEMRAGYDWYTGLQVVGDRAFVRTINLSYGIDNPQFGFFDLKTKKYSAFKFPDATFSDRVEQKAFADATLVRGPDAGVCLSWKGKVYQYDAEGRQVGETPLAKDDDGRLVGVWNGLALTADKDCLRLTALARTTAKSD